MGRENWGAGLGTKRRTGFNKKNSLEVRQRGVSMQMYWGLWCINGLALRNYRGFKKVSG